MIDYIDDTSRQYTYIWSGAEYFQSTLKVPGQVLVAPTLCNKYMYAKENTKYKYIGRKEKCVYITLPMDIVCIE